MWLVYFSVKVAHTTMWCDYFSTAPPSVKIVDIGIWCYYFTIAPPSVKIVDLGIWCYYFTIAPPSVKIVDIVFWCYCFTTSEVSSTVGYNLLCSYLSMSLTKSTFCVFLNKYIISCTYIQVFLLYVVIYKLKFWKVFYFV